MPILKPEIDLHPSDLFDAAPQPWKVAYVRSRQEKALARYLLRHDLPFYLPQYLHETRSGGRRRVSSLPLFAGYVFLPISVPQRRKAQESNLLVKLIDVVDQSLLHRELFDLWQLQSSGSPLVPHPYLEIGDEVDVIAGPLKGCRGKIQRYQGHLRLVLSVTFLRRSVSTTLARDAVVPANLPSPRVERPGRPASASAGQHLSTA
ncbi:MAG: transcription termination/antitermination NusG family protein [Acidobacteriota bacterium]